MTVNFRLSPNHESLLTFYIRPEAFTGFLVIFFCLKYVEQQSDVLMMGRWNFFSNSNLNIYASSLLFVDVIAYGALFSANQIVENTFFFLVC